MCRLKQLLEVVPRKKVLLKFENIKGDEYYMDHVKNIQTSIIKLFTIPHTWNWYSVLLNPWKILVKELFFKKISALQPVNAIKTNFLAKRFQGFCLLFRNS